MSRAKGEVAVSPEIMTTIHKKSAVRDYFESICIAVIFALFVRTFVVQAFKIPSSSMENNLLVGDHILVNKFALAPRPSWLEGILPYRDLDREDVIVFKYPKDARRDFIKRVIGKGGDRILIRNGRVIRNDEILDEDYIYIKPPGGHDMDPRLLEATVRSENRGPWAIGDDQYFMMGDNRLNSEDSRFWGTAPRSYVKGNALLIYWSFDVPEQRRPAEAEPDAPPADKASNLWYTLWNFPTRTRWSRTFKLVR